MHITLSPMRSDASLAVSRAGDTLTINGVLLDMSKIADGEIMHTDEDEWVSGPVRRTDGVLHLTLIVPHGATAPEAVRFPAPLIDPPDGPLALPQAG